MGLIRLIWEFVKIGTFTYGGGLAMIPLLSTVAIENGWLTNAAFANLIAIAQSTPGPIAINMATFIGYQQYGITGALLASIAVILPAFLMALIVARFLNHFNEHPVVKATLIGLKAAVIGLLATAILQVALVSLYSDQGHISNVLNGLELKSVALFLFFMWLIYRYKKHPIYYIVLAGILGNIIWSVF
ncbi:chromate transporter [Fusibacter sp. 3D3]|uniref:chromate transporter n=1 Tax=Fusibacter sp. 3D3 TaxID=1048380 RepID=UPI000852D775|nr:chromate transporter [Fusibacter sp. 3D3]GAU76973.1 chromate transport protein [Fusibacter sp. 3D3]